jgi:hypothetical protein
MPIRFITAPTTRFTTIVITPPPGIPTTPGTTDGTGGITGVTAGVTTRGTGTDIMTVMPMGTIPASATAITTTVYMAVVAGIPTTTGIAARE